MKNVRVKLKTKFIVSIISIVILFGTINIYLIRKITLESLGTELQRRGQFIAASLAEHITNSLLHEDYFTLQKYIDEINDLDKDVGYVFVQDKNGQLRAHNFEKFFPNELLPANSLKDGKEMNVELIYNKTNDVLYRDIAAPIMEGALGIVRVGLVEKSVTNQINRATFIFTAMVALFLVAGITGAFIFSYLITNPIYKIIKGFEQLNLDGTPKKIRVKTNDEIEYLVEKFNEMALRLQSAHNELLNTQEKLIHTEKLASIGTLVAGVAHEINNPLSGLKNCLNRIRKNKDGEEAEKYSDLMVNALDKIERVVKGLLDFSRKGSDQSIAVSINEIIGQSLDLVEHKLKKYNIKLVKVIDKKVGKVMGDPSQLEQVILNLMLNAIDSMLSGGELTLKTSHTGKKIFICIEDTGEGIPEKNLKKIFDPFFTTKGPGRGTGLGLPISYNFIKAHGGDISIKSSRGNGTRIKIWLPLLGINMNG